MTVEQQKIRQTSPILLSCEELCRLNEDGSYLLDHLNYQIFTGQRISIQGRAGSGKSLLLRSIAKLDFDITGKLVFSGIPVEEIATTKYRSQILLITQRTTLLPGSVEDNLKLPFQYAQNKHLSYEQQNMIKELAFFGKTEAFLKRDSQALSGGERQIVNLLRGLQLQPTILLLDEPTAALDDESSEVLENRVKQWINEQPTQRAYVWITHDKQQSYRVANIFWTVIEGKLFVESQEKSNDDSGDNINDK